jgi:cytochrome c-type biogenesis protein
VGPVLASILALAASGSDPAAGAFLLLVYSLGLGIPFVIAGVFVGTALRAFARIRKHVRTIQIICGALLVVYGALILGGQFGWLGDWLPAWTAW